MASGRSKGADFCNPPISPITNILLQAFYCIWPFLEVAVTVANAAPSLPLSSKITSAFVRSTQPDIAGSNLRVTPIFLIGWFLTVSGGLLRLSCYRTMGKMFTFELAIRKEHKLVTSGPYSIVRHPGYTALFMIMCGYSTCMMGAGSWLRECSGLSLDTVTAQVLMAIWVFNLIFIIFTLISRTKTEDAMLRNEFGSYWDEWAREVPYKLFPLIY